MGRGESTGGQPDVMHIYGDYHRTRGQRKLVTSTLVLFFVVDTGVPEFYFSTPHLELFDIDPPARGGGGDLTPSPPPSTILTSK